MAASDAVIANNGYAMVWPPIRCACGRLAAMMVNRDGKTRCVECDANWQRIRATDDEERQP